MKCAGRSELLLITINSGAARGMPAGEEVAIRADRKSRESRQVLEGSEAYGIRKFNVCAVFQGEHPVAFQGLVPVMIVYNKKGVARF